MPTPTLTLDSPIDDYAADLVALTLAQRDDLPKAKNGRPAAPGCAYAAHVVKDMASGKSAEFKRLMAVLVTNLRDGVPRDVVNGVVRRMEAILDVEAGAYRPRSIVALSRRETREQCLVDLAQLRIGPDNENDPEALAQLVGELTSYMSVADELRAEAERRIVYLRCGQSVDAPRDRAPSVPPTVAVGRRRGALVRIK